MHKAMFGFVFIVAILAGFKTPSAKACTENQYLKITVSGLVKCVDCPKCPAGYGPLLECGSKIPADAIIDCKDCAKGLNFSSTYDYEQCQPCGVCSKDQDMTSCAPDSNTVCHKKCISKENYFEQSSDDCQPCSWCCGDGNDVVKDECVTKGMPKHQSCTVHRRKKCTPAITALATTKSTTEQPLNFTTTQPTKSTISTTQSSSGVSTDKATSTDDNENSTPSWKIVVGGLSALLLIGILLAVIKFAVWNRRTGTRKQHRCGGGCGGGCGIPLVHVVPGRRHDETTGAGRKLFDLFETNYELKDTVCNKLDCKESFTKVARYYHVDEDYVKKMEERPGDHPTRDILSFIQSSNPNLLVSEFLTCMNEIGRNDVLEKIKKCL